MRIRGVEARIRPSLVLDVALVLAVTVLTEWDVWVFDDVAGPRWLTAALPLLIALPLPWRRSRPLLVVTLVMIGIAAQALASGDAMESFGPMLAIGVAAYSVAAYSERRRALAGLGVMAIGYAVYASQDQNVRSGRASELWAGAFFAVALLAAWLVGIFVRSAREQRRLEAEASARERTAQEAVSEERARLARELHDIVSHNLSVVVLQAGGARAQGEHAPDGTLEKIERSSRAALVEMRRLLGVLRDGDEAAGLSPQPGIAQLDALVETMRAAGLGVELAIAGDAREVVPAVDLTVYRIVQESLTNTLKHADACHARVAISRDADALTVTVEDDGGGDAASTAGAGHGLTGMRERVAIFGGELEAGPRPGGGFAVRARLPLREAE